MIGLGGWVWFGLRLCFSVWRLCLRCWCCWVFFGVARLYCVSVYSALRFCGLL